jgi:hypothetical protein
MQSRHGQLSSGVYFALAAVAATLVVLKMLTGLAFAPLAVVGVLVFVFALGLRLRMLRASTGSRRTYS